MFAGFPNQSPSTNYEQSHLSSIKIIHHYNPSRRLNRCIKITAKQMHVCFDSG